MKKQNVPNSQGGFVMLAVVVAMVVVGAIALLLSTESAMEADLTSRASETLEAEYVTQAALQHALWQNDAKVCSGDFNLPTTPLGAHSYAATITGGGTTTAYSLSADQDAWIRNDNPTSNGSADQHIRFESGNVEQALYRFDLSSLPAGAQINSASASFYVSAGGMGGGVHPEGPLTVHRVTEDWTEAGATWDTMNGNFDTQALGMIPPQPASGVPVQVNLTAQVQAWVNGQPNYGVLLGSTAEGVHAQYVSKEGVASEHPRLDVVVGTGQVWPVSITATGTLANGITRTLSRPLTSAYQSPGTVALQLGADPGADTLLDDFYARNYGGADYLQVNGDPAWLQWPLLKFDLETVPARASVLSARLELSLMSVATPGTATVHRVARSWIEGTQNGGGIADGATWATYDGTDTWTSAGGDFNAPAVAETAIDSSDTWVSWEIGPLVEQWLAGAPNDGLLIKAGGALRQAKFAARENSNAGVQPKLTITYACECGSACLAAKGSGDVLMLVGDDSVPTLGDLAKIALLESWGYTVDLQNDNTSASGIASQMNSHDVLFVAASVNPTTVGTNLTNLASGVVSETGGLNDELGIASGSATPVGSTINISDNGHYITLPFAAGPLNIYSAAMEGLAVAGAPAPGLQTLADWGGAGGLAALDAGGATSGGGTAAGRRVVLPIGAGIDLTHVNNNGRLIVQRAIAWGMNADAGVSGNLLMAVVDPGNLTSQEDQKKTLIEGWGYFVTLIDEFDSQGAYDTALAVNDVVFVTEDVGSSNISTKLSSATIGVVTEEDNLSDELGLSAGIAWDSGADIEINDNSHYITSPFATGPLTVLSLSKALAYVTGAQAPDLKRLASSVSGFAVVTLEAGATTHTGGTAAGRRAMLPWGGNDMDVASLNDDGLMIFRRALDWGAGVGVMTAPIAHWKLDEGGGPTAVDSVGGNDGTLSGDPTWTTGTIGGALDFDGSGDYVTTNSNFTPPPIGTVSFWIKVTGSPASHGRILGLGDTWEVRHVTTGTADGTPYGLVFDLGVSGTNTEFVTTTTIDSPGQWYHIAAAYDTTSDAYAVYVNGVPHKSGTYPSSLSVPAANPLSLGTRTGSSQYFDGTLDDVRVYDSVLSSAEITDIYVAGGGGGGGSGPTAHWRLDDGAGPTAIDSVGNHDGTLIGPGWTTGQLGGALDFDGSNDLLDVGTFDVSGSGLTLMGWFNADTIPIADPRIISKASGSAATDAWWQLSTTDSGSNRYLRMRIKAGGTTTTFADSSVNLQPGQWYFSVATYDNASGAMKLYLDGTEVASGSHAVGGPVDTGPTVPVAIGANGTAERFFDGVLDDVRVYGRSLSATEISDLFSVGGGGGSPPVDNYRDEFSAISYTGSDGTLTWSTDWLEVGEGDGPTSGDEQVLSDSGNDFTLRIRDNDNGGEGVQREADLAGCSSAILAFDYRRSSFDASSDYVTVDVSSNGGSSWTELERLQGPANETTYQSASYDISDYRAANTRIRFLTSSSLGGFDQFYVDNVEITCL